MTFLNEEPNDSFHQIVLLCALGAMAMLARDCRASGMTTAEDPIATNGCGQLKKTRSARQFGCGCVQARNERVSR